MLPMTKPRGKSSAATLLVTSPAPAVMKKPPKIIVMMLPSSQPSQVCLFLLQDLHGNLA